MLDISGLWPSPEISLFSLQDPYAAGAASSLGAEVYSPELNPYNIAQEAAVAAEGRKWFHPPSLPTSNFFFLLTNISLTDHYLLNLLTLTTDKVSAIQTIMLIITLIISF